MLSVGIAGSAGGVLCRQAAVSVALNIVEGHGRYHYLDSLRFYTIARGSPDETLSGFIICDQVGYTSGELPHQRELCQSALRSLNGYIRYICKRKQGRQEYGDRLHEHSHPDTATPESLVQE